MDFTTTFKDFLINKSITWLNAQRFRSHAHYISLKVSQGLCSMLLLASLWTQPVGRGFWNAAGFHG